MASGSTIAASAARQRVRSEPVSWLFSKIGRVLAAEGADAHRWRGLTIYGVDGPSLRVPDTAQNCVEFCGQWAGGPIERAVNHVVQQLIKRAGLRRSQSGAAATLARRAAWRSRALRFPEKRGFMAQRTLWGRPAHSQVKLSRGLGKQVVAPAVYVPRRRFLIASLRSPCSHSRNRCRVHGPKIQRSFWKAVS